MRRAASTRRFVSPVPLPAPTFPSGNSAQSQPRTRLKESRGRGTCEAEKTGIKVVRTRRDGLLEARLEYLPRLRLEDVPAELPGQPRAPNGLQQRNHLRRVNRDFQPQQRRVRARLGEGAQRCLQRRISQHIKAQVQPDVHQGACVSAIVLRQAEELHIASCHVGAVVICNLVETPRRRGRATFPVR